MKQILKKVGLIKSRTYKPWVRD